MDQRRREEEGIASKGTGWYLPKPLGSVAYKYKIDEQASQLGSLSLSLNKHTQQATHKERERGCEYSTVTDCYTKLNMQCVVRGRVIVVASEQWWLAIAIARGEIYGVQKREVLSLASALGHFPLVTYVMDDRSTLDGKCFPLEETGPTRFNASYRHLQRCCYS